MSGVVDLNPLLKARRQSSCPHTSLLVDETLAELECERCGKQINPYWYIERLADRWSEFAQQVADHEAQIRVEHERTVAIMNARAAQLRADIETLEAKKRQLMAEQVNGQPLGQQVKRWRRT